MRNLTMAASLSIALLLATAGTVAGQVASHPSHIHSGSCPAPGGIVVSLWDISEDFLVDGEPSAGTAPGSQAQAGSRVRGSVTDVEIARFVLLGTPHAIVVHASADDMGTYLVCGDLGGPVIGTGDVPVALEPVGSSPWSGVGLLRDNGDGNTTVSVFMLDVARLPDDLDDDDGFDPDVDDDSAPGRDDDSTDDSAPGRDDDSADDSAPSRDHDSADDSAPSRDDNTDD
ncbi:hypothetical protein BH23CHL8_BH23CHL8_14870 [soil metagenome]